MYRPEGWDAHQLLIDAIRTIPAREWTRERILESGADAMLEGLKKDSPIMSAEQMALFVPERKYPNGWLVFIPEDTE